MTHKIYVVGLYADEGDRFIREQNGSASRRIEYVNLTRVDQLKGLERPHVVTVGGFAMREDSYDFRREFKARNAQVEERHWGAREGF